MNFLSPLSYARKTVLKSPPHKVTFTLLSGLEDVGEGCRGRIKVG